MAKNIDLIKTTCVRSSKMISELLRCKFCRLGYMDPAHISIKLQSIHSSIFGSSTESPSALLCSWSALSKISCLCLSIPSSSRAFRFQYLFSFSMLLVNARLPTLMSKPLIKSSFVGLDDRMVVLVTLIPCYSHNSLRTCFWNLLNPVRRITLHLSIFLATDDEYSNIQIHL